MTKWNGRKRQTEKDVGLTGSSASYIPFPSFPSSYLDLLLDGVPVDGADFLRVLHEARVGLLAAQPKKEEGKRKKQSKSEITKELKETN